MLLTDVSPHARKGNQLDLKSHWREVLSRRAAVVSWFTESRGWLFTAHWTLQDMYLLRKLQSNVCSRSIWYIEVLSKKSTLQFSAFVEVYGLRTRVQGFPDVCSSPGMLHSALPRFRPSLCVTFFVQEQYFAIWNCASRWRSIPLPIVHLPYNPVSFARLKSM